MKVKNIKNQNGKTAPSQAVIVDYNGRLIFMSYGTIIAIKHPDGRVELDAEKWDYSVTTGKYRNVFLGETKRETEQKIATGVYQLAKLN